ncbi:6,7-dimethyl-8-ribityllumazine synthase [Opitutus terrae]|uniref:6,7-dimethyl-8-ribityllumazine synthase n=1 Tax=Opitutus terrae (strain DSM 11246 / JCM 15787 / PB90-1) TaxID=452637 RepID=B1ZVQ5_OPITP|nr:6,7-dimethyl-8-ribityllumazine synthase [Opitutus terrae]ACB74991.1 6,7-dimethyl-8-ribityllumazine synthase [Opitutus terrae PB90-1]
MSLAAPTDTAIDGTTLRVGIVAARFNGDLVDALLARAQERLAAAGVKPRHLTLVRVPGSHEVPWAVQQLAARGRRDVVIALGVLIGGETSHHEMVGQSVSYALQQVALTTGTPVINGVIVANTRAQAEARCRGRINRGVEFAAAALEIGTLKKELSR